MVINAIRDTLKEAQDSNVPNFPPLKNVDITLSTVASREGGAKFKILVFPIGGKVSNESPSTLKVTMKPPTTSALNVAKEAVVASNHADTPRLDITNIEIEIKFTVKKDGEAASCGSQ